MAGIQRRQLATLESGGNVTLATLRKVLKKLPNLEGFTIDVVNVTVDTEWVSERNRYNREKLEAAMKLMQDGIREMADALREMSRDNTDRPPELGEVLNTAHAALGALATNQAADPGRAVHPRMVPYDDQPDDAELDDDGEPGGSPSTPSA